MVQLVGKEIGPIGFGLMGLTWRQTPPSQEQAFEAMRAAVESGVNFWNGGEFYGTPDYNSLVLLERYFEKYPEDADRVLLSIKGGTNPDTHQTDASPANIRRSIDASIAQLKGRKKIDLWEFGRRDPAYPLKDTFELIDEEYVQTGKIGGISLSEVSAETIHEAVKYVKVLAVEVEVSLFSTDILENGVAAACHQYGIPIVGYSPIGRGMLTGQWKKRSDLPADSLLLAFNFPRFSEENFPINVQLVEKVEELARAKGLTAAQLAINWTRSLSRRPGVPLVVPIPGASTVGRVKENSKVYDLTEDEIAQIDEVLSKFPAAGERYPSIFKTNT
ncbi:pyridoxal reductase [Cladorrhinum sp. PSN332]|nr:pyridoxal reductase [Cladorrhinum sp. PSN332]